jgi:hypothetical protein
MPRPHLRVGSIHLIESIPRDELRTGERLFGDLEGWAHGMHAEFQCHFWREPTKVDFLNRLAEVSKDVRSSGRAPILHIEAHGTDDETGLVLASGEFVPWSEVKKPLTDINVTCRLNLLVVMAACNGRGLLEIVQPTDRAPMWGLIGPNRIVRAGEIEDANRAFYAAFFRTRDGDIGWNAMNAAVPGPRTFSFYGAKPVFRYVMSSYFSEFCNVDSLAERKKRVLDTLVADGMSAELVPAAETVISGYIGDHRTRFEEARAHFFFFDLCPEHDERFRVSLDECFPEAGPPAV